jgi:hypothetical protein
MDVKTVVGFVAAAAGPTNAAARTLTARVRVHRPTTGVTPRVDMVAANAIGAA